MTDAPKLDRLLADPAAVDTLPLEAVPAALAAVEHLRASLWARLRSAPTPQGEAGDHEGLLSLKEAARRLETTPDWLRRHARALPFTVRLSPGQLRFSAEGIRQWIRRQTPRL